jgi:hypothetical protein
MVIRQGLPLGCVCVSQSHRLYVGVPGFLDGQYPIALRSLQLARLCIAVCVDRLDKGWSPRKRSPSSWTTSRTMALKGVLWVIKDDERLSRTMRRGIQRGPAVS